MDFDRLTVLERRPLARLPKTAALGQYSCAEGDELPEQQHMGALCMALDAACSDCSDVAIEQLTLVVSPPWLAAWASQWLPHCPSGGAQRLRLTVVQGYAAEKAPLRASTVSWLRGGGAAARALLALSVHAFLHPPIGMGDRQRNGAWRWAQCSLVPPERTDGLTPGAAALPPSLPGLQHWPAAHDHHRAAQDGLPAAHWLLRAGWASTGWPGKSNTGPEVGPQLAGEAQGDCAMSCMGRQL